MTGYFEYSASAGPGTLIEHGVFYTGIGYCCEPIYDSHLSRNNTDHSQEPITEDRYNEFLSIHGGPVAV